MTKLEKISFYSQLADLFDVYKPEEVPTKIQEVVVFIKNHGDGQNDLDEMMKSLLVIKRGFEEALIEKKSWSMVLQNPSRGYKIAIDPITRCLSNPDSYAPITTPDRFFMILKEDMARYCLNEKNVNQYKAVLEIVNDLEKFINPFVISDL